MSDNFTLLGGAIAARDSAAAKAAIEKITTEEIRRQNENLIIPTLDEVLGRAQTGIQGLNLVTNVTEGLTKGLPDALKKWWKDWITESETEYQAKLDPIFTDMKNKGIITQDIVDEITSLAKDKPFWGSIMRWLSIFVIYISYFRHKMEAITSEANQQVNKQYRPNLPGPGEMLRAAFIAPEKTGYIRERLSRLGYKETDIDLMFIAQYGTYTVDEAFRLWLRGKLSDSDLIKRLREHGLTDVKINELKELYNVIPPIGDIFTLLAKEAFEPDQIAKFRLADEYPQQMEPYAAAHGLSPEWSKRFWYAHWVHPSPGQILEMLHRGLLSEEDVYQYYRVVEIPPYWRDMLMKISYTPYARVDTRRMYNLGVLNQQEVYNTYRDEGYDHDHATKLTQFSIQTKVEAQKDLTKAQMLDAFKIGLISKESVLAYLIDSGYDEAESTFLVEYTLYKEDLKDIDDAIKMIGERYKNGMIDEAQAVSLLTQLQLDSAVINKNINLWDAARFKGRRRLTKTELGDFLLGEIITPEEYVYEMTELGYQENHITWALRLLLKSFGGV
jgi:hypothetical protein